MAIRHLRRARGVGPTPPRGLLIFRDMRRSRLLFSLICPLDFRPCMYRPMLITDLGCVRASRGIMPIVALGQLTNRHICLHSRTCRAFTLLASVPQQNSARGFCSQANCTMVPEPPPERRVKRRGASQVARQRRAQLRVVNPDESSTVVSGLGEQTPHREQDDKPMIVPGSLHSAASMPEETYSFQVPAARDTTSMATPPSAHSADSMLIEDDDVPMARSADDVQSSVLVEEHGTTEPRTYERSPAAFARAHPSRTNKMFGIKRPLHFRGTGWGRNSSYKDKYPRDELYEELGPDARIWHVYLDEAEAFDMDMIEGWRDTIDVLLVFAGLFSAVVTAFVVQTSQALQPDYSKVTASLLTEMISLQRATALGQSVDDVLHSSLNVTTPFIAESTDRWINGLWFTSLSFSLTTALMSVLVKQWLQHYVSSVSGAAREQVHIRQFRFWGLDTWHVRSIVGWLPVLMHVSLLIFFGGLIIFLGPLDKHILLAVVIIAGSAYMTYFVTNLLPLFYPACLYKTPLTHHLNSLYHQCLKMIWLFSRLWNWFHWFFVAMFGKQVVKTNDPKPVVFSLRQQELDLIQASNSTMNIQSLVWLTSISSNPTVSDVVLEAVSAIDQSYDFDLLIKNGFLPKIIHALDGYCFHISEANDDNLIIVARLATAYIKLKLQVGPLDNDGYLNNDSHEESLNWDTWEYVVDIAKKKNLYQLKILGYCGLMLSTSDDMRIHRSLSIMADEMGDILQSHTFYNDTTSIPYLMLSAECLYKLLRSTSAYQIYFDWKFMFLLYNMFRQEFAQIKNHQNNDIVVLIIKCLHSSFYKCYDGPRAWNRKNYARPLAHYIPFHNNEPAMMYLDILYNTVMCYTEWCTNENQTMLNLLIEDLQFRLSSTSKLKSFLKHFYLVFGKFLRSPFWIGSSSNTAALVLSALHNLPEFQITSTSIEDQIWNSHVVTTLCSCLDFYIQSNDISLKLSIEILWQLNRCFEVNQFNCFQFMVSNGIETLQTLFRALEHENNVSLLDECYEAIGHIFDFVFSNNKTNADSHNLQSLHPWQREILEHLLKSDNIAWCYFIIGHCWTPKRLHSCFKRFYLLQVYHLSRNSVHQEIWLTILKDLILRTRNVMHFNRSKQEYYHLDFDILQELKFLLAIDDTDENYKLYEYTLTYVSHRELAESRTAMYPEVVLPNFSSNSMFSTFPMIAQRTLYKSIFEAIHKWHHIEPYKAKSPPRQKINHYRHSTSNEDNTVSKDIVAN